MGFTLMPGHRLGDNREDMERRRRRRSAEGTYPWGDTAGEMEMRMRRRSEANNHWGGPEEEMEMRRMRRSAMDFGDGCAEMEMRRRRNEMGFDTRQNEAGESVSQQFFNAIMGSCQEEAKAEKADTSWCDSLAKLQKQEAACESGSGENREERASADGSV